MESARLVRAFRGAACDTAWERIGSDIYSNKKRSTLDINIKIIELTRMGSLVNVIDAILFLFFLIIVIAAPLIDGQTVLPLNLYPTFLLDLKAWYTKQYGDFLVSEKPHFFVGIVWLELFFQWPLAVACLYGIVASKSWINTTCLLYGGSCLSTMAAIIAELLGSERTSEKLLRMYFPFMGFAALAILRGLLPSNSGKTAVISRRPILNRKKRT